MLLFGSDLDALTCSKNNGHLRRSLISVYDFQLSGSFVACRILQVSIFSFKVVTSKKTDRAEDVTHN